MGPGGHGDLNKLQPSGDQHSLLPHLSYAQLSGGRTWASHNQEPKATSLGQAVPSTWPAPHGPAGAWPGNLLQLRALGRVPRG